MGNPAHSRHRAGGVPWLRVATSR